MQETQFFVVPASHSMENINPILIGKSTEWLNKAFPEFTPLPKSSSANRVLFYGVFLWGLLGLICLLCIHLLSLKKVHLGLSVLFLLGFGYALSPWAALLPFLWAANGLLLASLTLILSQGVFYTNPDAESRQSAFKTLYLKGTLLLIFSVFIYTLILAINAKDLGFQYMGIIDLLLYAARFVLSLPWVLQQGIKPHLFEHYSSVLIPAWPLILIGIEALFSPLGRSLKYLQKNKSQTKTPELPLKK
jgi:hypothetical protein